MTTQTFASVWDAIKDTPEEAAAMRVRSDLMMAIEQTVRGWKVPQREAARRLGITQPRLNDLLTGKISKFSLDALVSMSPNAGLEVELKARPVPAVVQKRTTTHRVVNAGKLNKQPQRKTAASRKRAAP
jgi:predicted XRE-type DNA-binding protein